METRASYVAVGAFVLTLVIGAFAFAVWLAKIQLDQSFDRYVIFFEGSVSGLQEGSTVRFRGIPVGTVQAIEIAPDNVERVRVTVEIPETVPITEGTQAALELQGITGQKFVQLTGGREGAPLIEPKADQDFAEIPATRSALDTVFDNAPELVDQFSVIMEQAGAMLSPANVQSITGILADFRTVSGAVAERRDEISTMIADSQETMAELRAASSALAGLATTLEGDASLLTEELSATLATFRGAASGIDGEVVTLSSELQESIASIKTASDNFGATSARLNTLIDDNQTALTDFSNEGLYQFTLFLSDARKVLSAIDRVSGTIERDPATFLFGDSRTGVEVE